MYITVYYVLPFDMVLVGFIPHLDVWMWFWRFPGRFLVARGYGRPTPQPGMPGWRGSIVYITHTVFSHIAFSHSVNSSELCGAVIIAA